MCAADGELVGGGIAGKRAGKVGCRMKTSISLRTEQINLQNRGPAKPNFLVPRNLGTGAPLSGRGPSSSEEPAKQLL